MRRAAQEICWMLAGKSSAFNVTESSSMAGLEAANFLLCARFPMSML
jgi:hypothetical protein